MLLVFVFAAHLSDSPQQTVAFVLCSVFQSFQQLFLSCPSGPVSGTTHKLRAEQSLEHPTQPGVFIFDSLSPRACMIGPFVI